MRDLQADQRIGKTGFLLSLFVSSLPNWTVWASQSVFKRWIYKINQNFQYNWNVFQTIVISEQLAYIWVDSSQSHLHGDSIQKHIHQVLIYRELWVCQQSEVHRDPKFLNKNTCLCKGFDFSWTAIRHFLHLLEQSYVTHLLIIQCFNLTRRKNCSSS